jgi:hypothetical protein
LIEQEEKMEERPPERIVAFLEYALLMRISWGRATSSVLILFVITGLIPITAGFLVQGNLFAVTVVMSVYHVLTFVALYALRRVARGRFWEHFLCNAYAVTCMSLDFLMLALYFSCFFDYRLPAQFLIVLAFGFFSVLGLTVVYILIKKGVFVGRIPYEFDKRTILYASAAGGGLGALLVHTVKFDFSLSTNRVIVTICILFISMAITIGLYYWLAIYYAHKYKLDEKGFRSIAAEILGGKHRRVD